MNRQEARDFLRSKIKKHGDIMNIEVYNDDDGKCVEITFGFISDSGKCYYGIYNDIDGVDLEQA